MLYREALNIDSTCIEALYNLALAYYQVGDFENAITTLHRLDQILPNQFTAMYLLAKCYVDVGNTTLALDWLQKCHDNFDFCDIEILQKIGNVADKEGDLTKAFSSYRDAHTKLPGDIDTIAWLGNYYINDTKFPEKALKYFKKAVLIQPNEVRWHLLVALCLNRDGKTQKAFQKYQAIHNQFPDNLDCLKRLVVMAEQLGDVELMKEYKDKIIRSEKQMVANQQNRINSGRIRSGRTENRSGSARNRVPSGHNRSNHPSGTLPSFTGNTATPSPLSTMNLSSNLPPTGRRGPEEQAQPTRELDTDFADPLANQMSMRPKTAKNKNAALAAMQDNVEDYDVDDLLPD